MSIFDDVVSGNGEFVFGTSTPSYVLWEVTTIGSVVRVYDLNNPDKLAKLGWFSFFHEGFDTGELVHFYDEPIWMNWVTGRWHVSPALILGGANMGDYAEGIRWSVSLGSEVRLIVGP